MQREQIRPSLADLNDQFYQSDGSDDENDVLEYAPAATPFRGPPPVIRSSSGPQEPQSVSNDGASSSALAASQRHALPSTKNPGVLSTPRKVVRIAPSSSDQVREIKDNNANSHARSTSRFAESRRAHALPGPVQGPESFRFNLNVDEEEEEMESGSEQERNRPAPLIGTIQERENVKAQQPKLEPGEKKKISKFAQMRREEKLAGEDLVEGKDSPKTRLDCSEDDEWLDEDGQPMSAFRIDRLRKQGQGPTSTRPKAPYKKTQGSATKSLEASNDKSSPSLMTSISQQNTAKVEAMSAGEIEQALAELRDIHGAGLLENFKALKGGNGEHGGGSVPPFVERYQGKTQGSERHYAEQNSEQIRAKYFPDEPEKLPLSLQWTKSLENTEDEKGMTHTFRFNFLGKIVDDATSSPIDSHLNGLHHHGSEQSRAGYSVEELLHLARSTLPSQRIIALQTLERIFALYPESASQHDEQDSSVEQKVAKLLVEQSIRGMAGVIASWYIEDRQVSLRSAALRCLQRGLQTTLAGPSPVQCVESTAASREHATDQSKEAVYDVSNVSFHVALLPCLCKIITERNTASNDKNISLEIIVFLCSRSVDVCSALLEQSMGIESIVECCISNKTWPTSKSEEGPVIHALRLLLILVSSARSNAASLIKRGCIDPLLRFLAIPPWFTAVERQSSDVWNYLDLTMQIYAALAIYGMYSDVLQKGHSVLSPVLDWIRTFDASEEKEAILQLPVLQSCLRCLSMWVVCAIDPHQTAGHHDIGWNQVAEWWECAVECGNRITSSPLATSNLLYTSLLAEAVSLLDNWLECASRNDRTFGQSTKEEIRKSVAPLPILVDQLRIQLENCSDRMNACAKERQTRPFWMCGLEEARRLAEVCQAAKKVMLFLVGRSGMMSAPDLSVQKLQDASQILLLQPFWRLFEGDDARQAGVDGLRRIVIDFCCFSLESLSEVDEGTAVSNILQLLSILREGDEAVARKVISVITPAKIECILPSDLFVVSPFTNEMLRTTKNYNAAPLHVNSSSLSLTKTLFVGVSDTIKEEGEDENVDPINGVTLWKSAASGLPLRADWALAALDDLLHSGNCAALNRRNALHKAWDANERQIVVSSLRLAVQLCSVIPKQARLPSLDTLLCPTSSELHLAIIKVFMLEEEQSQNPKASGLITGRDLFRDAEIGGLLEHLFELAKATDDEGEDGLEQAAKRQFGISLPFYQLYTSFMGLYDSISFGMELFGRAVLLPQSNKYATDYKRLMWIDYASTLSTLTTKCDQSPYLALTRFLAPNGEDQDVVQAMVRALLSGDIKKDRNELLYSIAVQQIGHEIWSSPTRTDRVVLLAKTIFSASPGASSLQTDVINHGSNDSIHSEELARRQTWLATTVHSRDHVEQMR
ncbi:hypothetical protein CBS101457_003832 [Exobasidium rhododendri]|nr:hypothetical protein CBS101457_003832 [Exobasidium rhododendri]